jgi:hypothetical protein
LSIAGECRLVGWIFLDVAAVQFYRMQRAKADNFSPAFAW